MEKATAIRVDQLARHAQACLNEAIRAAQNSGSQQEFEAFRVAVGKIMGAIVIDVLHPIYAEHPDIVPEELK